MKLATSSIVLAVAAITAGSSAYAQTITHVDRGWYHSSGLHQTFNDNYFTGICGSCALSGEYRNFFVFDLSSISDPIVAATLCVTQPSNGYVSPDPTETYALYDYVGNISALVAGTGGLTAFDDLATGMSYGETEYAAASNGTLTMIRLNEDGLCGLNAARGGLFAMGGAVTSLGLSTRDEYTFARSGGSGISQLVLSTGGVDGFLVFGDGFSSRSLNLVEHNWTTQVGRALAVQSVAPGEMFELVMPPRSKVQLRGLGPVSITAPGPSGMPRWMAGGSFSVQFIMWNDSPSQMTAGANWSNGLVVQRNSDGSVTSLPYGSTTGPILGVKSWKNAKHETVMGFPINLPRSQRNESQVTARRP